MTIFDTLEHFKPAEFVSPDEMSERLLIRLDQMRELAGVPIKITSSYREGDKLSHGDGEAVDIACTDSDKRLLLVMAALAVGFRRLGVYDKHLHADVSERLPQEVMWWGTSK